MNLLPFANILEAAGLGKKGESIFLNMLPAEAEHAVLLRPRFTGEKVNYELPGYYKNVIQVIVRVRDFSEGEQFADQVNAALMVNEANVGNMFVRYMRPSMKPVPYPLSNGNFFEFNTLFDIVYNEDDVYAING